jgi:hypothetical protein
METDELGTGSPDILESAAEAVTKG